MTSQKTIRTGGAIIMLLVVLLLVGLLTQQTVRSLWILRRTQDRQANIVQANQLLELGRNLDQRSREINEPEWKKLPLIVPVGSEYGRLDSIEQSSADGIQHLWVAKLPVDANGLELPNQLAVVVSCERSEL